MSVSLVLASLGFPIWLHFTKQKVPENQLWISINTRDENKKGNVSWDNLTVD